MGQVIRFAATPRNRPATAALDVAEWLLLAAIRWWVTTFRRDEDPRPRLCAKMAAASLTRAGGCGLAERALRTALLTAQGAEFVLGPLH